MKIAAAIISVLAACATTPTDAHEVVGCDASWRQGDPSWACELACESMPMPDENLTGMCHFTGPTGNDAICPPTETRIFGGHNGCCQPVANTTDPHAAIRETVEWFQCE